MMRTAQTLQGDKFRVVIDITPTATPRHSTAAQIGAVIASVVQEGLVTDINATRDRFEVTVVVPADTGPMALKRLRERLVGIAQAAWDAAT